MLKYIAVLFLTVPTIFATEKSEVAMVPVVIMTVKSDLGPTLIEVAVVKKELSKEEVNKIRLTSLFEQARNLVEKYDAVNGKASADKLNSRWRVALDDSQQTEQSYANCELVSKLQSIKARKKEGKEISTDLLYEASFVFLKYSGSDEGLILPTCVKPIFEEKETYDWITTMMQAAMEKLEKR